MPAYNFLCKKCNNEFELFLRTNEKGKCVNCKSTRIERLFSKSVPISNDKSSSYKEGEAKEDAMESLNNDNNLRIGRKMYSDRKTGKFLGLGEPEVYTQ